MPTFFHGTTTSREESVLKYGLKMSWGDGREGRFVWMTPSFQEAAKYARMRAMVMRIPVGSIVDYIAGPFSRQGDPLGMPTFRVFKVSKMTGVAPQARGPLRIRRAPQRIGPIVVDPNSQPIVFEIAVPENWRVTESPTVPGEWRVARNVPPSMLTLLIRLQSEMTCSIPEDGGRAADVARKALLALEGDECGSSLARKIHTWRDSRHYLPS
jgi:hypothetical protein